MTAKTAAKLGDIPAMTLKPRYEENKDGIFYIGVKAEEGKIVELPPVQLSSRFELIGRGIDSGGSHYRIIQWKDRLSRQTHTAALPMADIGVNWGWFRRLGIFITSARRNQERLTDYLQNNGQQTAYIVTNQSGWCSNGKAYTLPSGEVLAAESGKANVIYNGDTSQAAAYAESGSLQEWQENIARYMAGNSRLSLAIGTALAAPLVSLLGMEAGGFHLFGDSRDGKSTAARAALSVWGKPDGLMLTWAGTGIGFNNVANARNDGLLVLDEISQATPRHVSSAAYSVINGVSKIQGAKEGGNRDISRWRVLLLSTGEKPLDTFLAADNVDWNAGQSARLPSVPSDAGKGLGVFDTLHGHSKGSALSEAITEAAAKMHGTAGRALIRLLLNQPAIIEEARQLQSSFMGTLPDVEGQARTVATRFAMVAAALELCARHGITGLPENMAFPAIKQCFDAWMERQGIGKHEDMEIIKQAVAFMQTNGSGMRFIDWNSTHQVTNANHAGYRLSVSDGMEYWVTPAVFESEICKGYDRRKCCIVLNDAEWLKKHSDSRYTYQKKGYGRFYVFVGLVPPNYD